MAEDDRRRNEQTLHGGVRKFLRDADLDAWDASGGVRVGTATFTFSTTELAAPLVVPVVDRLVAELLPAQLLQAIQAELSARHPSLSVTQNGNEVSVTGPNVEAAITATRATVRRPHHRVIVGNFLRSGGQDWDALHQQLSQFERIDEIQAIPLRAAPLIVFPSALDGARRTEAFAASARIRLARSRDFGVDTRINVPASSCSVRFSPVLAQSPVEVAFDYTRGDARIQGALRLRTPHDPLALILPTGVDDQSVIADVWATVLCTYADLTCVPVADAASTLPPTDSRDEGSLTPSEETRLVLASHVAGYRRHLPSGHRARPEARQRAETIGIVLAADETWVRPHMRGTPDDLELVFTWRGATHDDSNAERAAAA